MKTYVSAIIIIIISVLITISGCVGESGNITESNNQTPEQIEPEADENTQINSNDNQTTKQTELETVETQESESDFAVSDESNENTNSIEQEQPQSASSVKFQASALSEGKYLLEQKEGEGIDLSGVKLIISSHGHTYVYSPLTENREILNIGDQMVIDINSAVFMINGEQITVTQPGTVDSSVTDTSIILFDISSDKMLAYMTVTE